MQLRNQERNREGFGHTDRAADSDGACLYLCSVMCIYGVKTLCVNKITKHTCSSHVGISVMITFSVRINTMASLCIIKYINKCDE